MDSPIIPNEVTIVATTNANNSNDVHKALGEPLASDYTHGHYRSVYAGDRSADVTALEIKKVTTENEVLQPPFSVVSLHGRTLLSNARDLNLATAAFEAAKRFVPVKLLAGGIEVLSSTTGTLLAAFFAQRTPKEKNLQADSDHFLVGGSDGTLLVERRTGRPVEAKSILKMKGTKLTAPCYHSVVLFDLDSVSGGAAGILEGSVDEVDILTIGAWHLAGRPGQDVSVGYQPRLSDEQIADAQ